MDQIKHFEEERTEWIRSNETNRELQKATIGFMQQSMLSKYSYNLTSLGRPIIQYPQDIVAVQELIWEVKPDLIIEAGIAHGGSLILSASMLLLLDYCEAQQKGKVLDPSSPKRKALGIDIHIRAHNREAIEAHPMNTRIEMIEGASTDLEVIEKVKTYVKRKETVMVLLDSNHTHENVLRELELYSPFVTKGSYLVAFDTVIEYMPDEVCINRPWGKGNNPMTAVHEFLNTHDEFEIDKNINNKLIITAAPDGYLRRVK